MLLDDLLWIKEASFWPRVVAGLSSARGRNWKPRRAPTRKVGGTGGEGSAIWINSAGIQSCVGKA